jgi:hypothetical protein
MGSAERNGPLVIRPTPSEIVFPNLNLGRSNVSRFRACRVKADAAGQRPNVSKVLIVFLAWLALA